MAHQRSHAANWTFLPVPVRDGIGSETTKAAYAAVARPARLTINRNKSSVSVSPLPERNQSQVLAAVSHISSRIRPNLSLPAKKGKSANMSLLFGASKTLRPFPKQDVHHLVS